MTVDDTFRLILLANFTVVLPFALYHRLRSHTGESLDRWQEGIFILFGTRLGGIPFLIGGIAWMINPQRMAWASVPIPIWLRWLGFVLIGFGGFLLVWTFRNLGKNLTDTVVTRKNHSLVTTGPYRFVRHPFYMAGIVAIIGGSLVRTWRSRDDWFPTCPLILSSVRSEKRPISLSADRWAIPQLTQRASMTAWNFGRLTGKFCLCQRNESSPASSRTTNSSRLDRLSLIVPC
jgi:protein-S-isoprenylcysteine O-methyltransferase Ste14